MSTAHNLAIGHGDLKPANLLVTHNKMVKITDFGLSRRAALSQDSETIQNWISTDEEKIAETPTYISPKQSRGEPLTPKNDVFSLDTILYEMLTSQPAFTG